MNDYILPLSDASATLEKVGGKGLSLTKLTDTDLPVPVGFHITTEAYRAFIAANDLQTSILTAIEDVDISVPTSLEKASTIIEKLFSESAVPQEVETAIQDAYSALQSKSTAGVPEPKFSVAIRSSATAEDLPEASFAGQQETYLNVHGIEAVLEAVKKCWASLWTARAIAYRIKNKINQGNITLAVVVQEMIHAEAAGILFTANPINGRLDEIVINAAWGLGEAIVGGLVTPDTIIVEKGTGKVKKIDVAEKDVITVLTLTGTEEVPLTGAQRKAQVLEQTQIAELVGMARRIEDFYGSPQDIEWCCTNGSFYIMQSRPITTLKEPETAALKEWKLPRGAYAALRNNIVELMADPLSPLFATLGLSAVNTSLNRYLSETFAMQGILPDETIIVVNHYAYYNGSIRLSRLPQLFFGAGKIMKKMFTGAVERWTETGKPGYDQIVENWQAKDWRTYSSVELIDSARQLTESAIDAYCTLVSGVIPAAWITEAIFTQIYNWFVKRRGDPSAPVYLLGYDSLPIKADKNLYSLADWARKDSQLLNYLENTATSQIVADLNEITNPPNGVPAAVWEEWGRCFHEHLQKFGHTIYNLDFANSVPADDPEPVVDTFKLYLSEQGTNPYSRQRESVERREQAVISTRERLKGRRLKWFNKYLASAQKYAPLREDGLAEVGLAYPLIRQILLELGARFAQEHCIPEAEDIFWLTEEEVLLAGMRLDAGQTLDSMAEIIPIRKAEHKAALRFQPPLALPQMKVFGFDLMSLKAKQKRRSKGDEIKGVATSPGKATGTARILYGPADFSRMNPGDVLVASITTPAWTPLFAMASAVVTDVGGPLSHGSIVAREYGIPAVLGTGVATRRIRDGQTITVDGSAGIVVLLAGK